MNHKDEFPLRLYEYNTEGRYGKPVRIDNAAQLEIAMRTTVRRALDEKREIRITDMDDFLCFHARNGGIVFPPVGPGTHR